MGGGGGLNGLDYLLVLGSSFDTSAEHFQQHDSHRQEQVRVVNGSI